MTPPPTGRGGGSREVHVHGRPRFVTVAPCAIGSVVRVRDADAPSVLAHRASHDGLTGLLNQRAFRERLAAEAARALELGRPLSLIVVDLDHFKAVNDVRGHPTGDRVLVEAAARIAGAARAVDAVGRIGGEEFAWLLPEDAAAAALIAAQRLKASFRSAPFAGGLDVTASMGICDLATARDADTLLRRADEALYWSKAFGRDAALVWSARTASRIARARTASAGDLAAPARGSRTAAIDALAALTVTGHGARVAEPELEHIRQHARLGAGLADGALDAEQTSWIRHHHERHDGAGYPDRLAGDAIPEGAALIAIADAWDTMIASRPYRPGLGVDAALAEIDACTGTQLHPRAGTLLRAALAWLAQA